MFTPLPSYARQEREAAKSAAVAAVAGGVMLPRANRRSGGRRGFSGVHTGFVGLSRSVDPRGGTHSCGFERSRPSCRLFSSVFFTTQNEHHCLKRFWEQRGCHNEGFLTISGHCTDLCQRFVNFIQETITWAGS